MFGEKHVASPGRGVGRDSSKAPLTNLSLAGTPVDANAPTCAPVHNFSVHSFGGAGAPRYPTIVLARKSRYRDSAAPPSQPNESRNPREISSLHQNGNCRIVSPEIRRKSIPRINYDCPVSTFFLAPFHPPRVITFSAAQCTFCFLYFNFAAKRIVTPDSPDDDVGRV